MPMTNLPLSPQKINPALFYSPVESHDYSSQRGLQHLAFMVGRRGAVRAVNNLVT
jgi:hypothetical protein